MPATQADVDEHNGMLAQGWAALSVLEALKPCPECGRHSKNLVICGRFTMILCPECAGEGCARCKQAGMVKDSDVKLTYLWIECKRCGYDDIRAFKPRPATEVTEGTEKGTHHAES